MVASSSDSRFAASYLRQRLSADISVALGPYSYLEGPTFLLYRKLYRLWNNFGTAGGWTRGAEDPCTPNRITSETRDKGWPVRGATVSTVSQCTHSGSRTLQQKKGKGVEPSYRNTYCTVRNTQSDCPVCVWIDRTCLYYSSRSGRAQQTACAFSTRELQEKETGEIITQRWEELNSAL